MVHVTVPKSSNNSCNVTASHTRQAVQIIQDLMDLLREWLELLRKGKPWISGLFDYRGTPQSESIASPLQLMTQHLHSKGKELTPIAQCTWCPRNAPNSPGAHQKAREHQ